MADLLPGPRTSVRAVWKYQWPLPHDRASFDMPRGAQVLSTAAQYDGLCLWARVDPNEQKEKRTFALCGTGHAAPLDFEGRFIGTALLHGGTLVLHVFECQDPRQ